MLTYLMLHPTPATSDRPRRGRIARTIQRLRRRRDSGQANPDARPATLRLLHDVGMGGTAATAATRVMRALATRPS